jgi:predicted dithiol-disulfide oxidoreductase (DUF899 family)
MSLPEIASEQQWLAARRELLATEKDLTRRRDALNADRRRLPMVRVANHYRFTGPGGEPSLLHMFQGRRQLVIQHFMFDPDWDAGCGGCTAGADEISDGLLRHLNARETSFAAISRAPYPKLAAFKQAKGWTFPWYSSYGSRFNYDFHVSLDASVTPVMFNYRGPAELEQAGLGWMTGKPMEQPGISCFLRDGEHIFHTYSTFGRGTEGFTDAYQILDLTALGRQEAWEEPKDRVDTARPATPDFAE